MLLSPGTPKSAGCPPHREQSSSSSSSRDRGLRTILSRKTCAPPPSASSVMKSALSQLHPRSLPCARCARCPFSLASACHSPPRRRHPPSAGLHECWRDKGGKPRATHARLFPRPPVIQSLRCDAWHLKWRLTPRLSRSAPRTLRCVAACAPRPSRPGLSFPRRGRWRCFSRAAGCSALFCCSCPLCSLPCVPPRWHGLVRRGARARRGGGVLRRP